MTRKMTLEFELDKMGFQFQLGQIRDSPQFVLNKICDFVPKSSE